MTSADYLRSSDSLVGEMFELKEHESQPYLSDERKENLRRRMAVISFELRCRAEELEALERE